ncbi:MAG: hypothetical protein AAF355_06655 [Myxococcota bacterium]
MNDGRRHFQSWYALGGVKPPVDAHILFEHMLTGVPVGTGFTGVFYNGSIALHPSRAVPNEPSPQQDEAFRRGHVVPRTTGHLRVSENMYEAVYGPDDWQDYAPRPNDKDVIKDMWGFALSLVANPGVTSSGLFVLKVNFKSVGLNCHPDPRAGAIAPREVQQAVLAAIRSVYSGPVVPVVSPYIACALTNNTESVFTPMQEANHSL